MRVITVYYQVGIVPSRRHSLQRDFVLNCAFKASAMPQVILPFPFPSKRAYLRGEEKGSLAEARLREAQRQTTEQRVERDKIIYIQV